LHPAPKVPQKGGKSKQKPIEGTGEAVQALAVLDGRQFVVVPRGPHLPPPAPPPEGALPAGRPAPAEPLASAAPSRPHPSSFSSDLAARMSAVLHIFSFLTVKELLRVSRVNNSWRLLAENRPLVNFYLEYLVVLICVLLSMDYFHCIIKWNYDVNKCIFFSGVLFD